MNALLHILALIGITLIIVRGTIFRLVRRLWPAMLQCAQCTGLWVGVFAGASGVFSTGHGRLIDAVIVGAATSFSALLADAVLLSLLGNPNE